MRTALVAAGVLWLAALPLLVDRLLRALRLRRPNFLGREIPVGYGLIISLWSLPALFAALRLHAAPPRELAAYGAVIGGFGLLGFADDLWGDRSSTGLRGHLISLLKRGRLTTGLVKLLGGVLVGLLVPRILLRAEWQDALLDGAVIALSANGINLLDLRPGRACAAFLVLAVALSAPAWLAGDFPPLALVIAPALVVYERDARGLAMMGDTGSNALGGALGLAAVLALPSATARLWLLGALVALHLVAERWSISAIIESNPVLRWLDGLTGIRLAKLRIDEADNSGIRIEHMAPEERVPPASNPAAREENEP